MSLLEEMEEEDVRFRTAIKSAANECNGDLPEVFARLSEESKAKQRAIFEKYRTPATVDNGAPVFTTSFPAPHAKSA